MRTTQFLTDTDYSSYCPDESDNTSESLISNNDDSVSTSTTRSLHIKERVVSNSINNN